MFDKLKGFFNRKFFYNPLQDESKIEALQKEGIPTRYHSLCLLDDQFEHMRGLSGLLPSGRGDNKFSALIKSGKNNSLQARMVKYRTIIAEMKLDIAPHKRQFFQIEAESILNELSPESPSSWISYRSFLLWCLKFVEKYPFKNSIEEEDDVNTFIESNTELKLYYQKIRANKQNIQG